MVVTIIDSSQTILAAQAAGITEMEGNENDIEGESVQKQETDTVSGERNINKGTVTGDDSSQEFSESESKESEDGNLEEEKQGNAFTESEDSNLEKEKQEDEFTENANRAESKIIAQTLVASSGSINDTVNWKYDENTKTLTISGKGELSFNSPWGMPWYEFREDIENAAITGSFTEIDTYFFYGCTNLKRISIPDSVQIIGYFAFGACVSLEVISIPAKVEIISDTAFDGCWGLKEYNVAAANKNFSSVNGVLFDKAKKTLISYPIAKEETSYLIPAGITTIKAGAFSFAENLVSVTIPDSVKTLEEYVFSNCTGIENIVIPQSVTRIEDNAFSECIKLKNINLPKNVAHIGADTFSICNSLEKVYVYNPDCTIGASKATFPTNAVIYGYTGSTAQSYAKKYGKKFVDLESKSEHDYAGDNAAYVSQLPQEILEDSWPVDNSTTMWEMDGNFAGYQSYILKETDKNKAKYQEINNFTKELTSSCISDYERAEIISEWVTSNMTYRWGGLPGNSIDSVYSLWKNRTGNCMSYTLLTNFMLATLNIPTATVTSYDHQWSAVQINGQWIMIDSTNGIFNADSNNYDEIEMISFSSGNLCFVIDGLDGIFLSGVGISYSEKNNIKSVLIPNYVTGIYAAAFDDCNDNIQVSGKRNTDIEKQLTASGFVCMEYSENTYDARYVHKWGSWKTTQAATALKQGNQTKTCIHCKKEEKKKTAKLKATIKTNASTIPLKTGQSTKQFKISEMAKGDYVKSIKSSNTKIVKVTGVTKTGNCKLTAAKKTGTVTLTITLASGKKKSVKVNVQKSTVMATKISNIPSKLNLKKGQTYNLQPKITPITVTSKITYKSSKKAIVTINSKGKIVAKKKGKATITVKCGKKAKEFIVNVK